MSMAGIPTVSRWQSTAVALSIFVIFSLICSRTLSSPYLVMDDVGIYEYGSHPSFVGGQGRIIEFYLNNMLFHGRMDLYYPVRYTIFLLCYLWVGLLTESIWVETKKLSATLSAMALFMASVPFIVFEAWATLGIHVPAYVLVSLTWKMIRDRLSVLKFSIASVLIVLSLHIYQVALFFLLAPCFASILSQGFLIRRHGGQLMRCGLVSVTGAVLYLLTLKGFLSFQGIPASDRLGRSAELLQGEALMQRLAGMKPYFSAYLYPEQSALSLSIVASAALAGALALAAFHGVRHPLNRGKRSFFLGIISVTGIFASTLVPPLLGGGGTFLREDLPLTLLFTISLSLFVFELAARTFKPIRLALIGLIALGSIHTGMANMKGYVYPYQLEQAFIRAGIEKAHQNYCHRVAFVAPKLGPHDHCCDITQPTLGHEPSIKLTSEYAEWNQGALGMYHFAIETLEGPLPDSLTEPLYLRRKSEQGRRELAAQGVCQIIDMGRLERIFSEWARSPEIKLPSLGDISNIYEEDL